MTSDVRTAGLYDTHTLEQLLPMPVNSLPLALTPDGRHLAVSVEGRRLEVWDLAEVRRQFREVGIDWNNYWPQPGSPPYRADGLRLWDQA